MGFCKMRDHLWKCHDIVLPIKDISTVPFAHMEYLNPSAKDKKASPTRAAVAPTPVDVEALPTVAVVEADV